MLQKHSNKFDLDRTLYPSDILKLFISTSKALQSPSYHTNLIGFPFAITPRIIFGLNIFFVHI